MKRKAKTKKVKTEGPGIQTVKVTEEFEVILSDEKKVEYGEEAAEIYQQIRRDTEEMKQITTKLKSEIREKVNQVGRLLDAVNSGREVLMLTVNKILDYNRGLVRYTSDEKYEIADPERPLSENERQMNILASASKTKVEANGFDEVDDDSLDFTQTDTDTMNA